MGIGHDKRTAKELVLISKYLTAIRMQPFGSCPSTSIVDYKLNPILQWQIDSPDLRYSNNGSITTTRPRSRANSLLA